MNSFKVIAKGKVQGVGFRYTAKNLANQLNITGYAKNLPDGTVEMELHGLAKDLETFFQKIEEEFSPELQKEEMGFEIRS